MHYEAPSAERLDAEMRAFVDWLNDGAVSCDPIIKAALAHLWFETIHPFDDGNGRIARAITDLCLARSEQSAQRFYSMSWQIRAERKTYYETLEATQKGTLDVTPWLRWFLACLDRAFDRAETILGTVLQKARIWETHSAAPLNERQRAILNRLLDGFEGILAKNEGGGRSTSYALVLPPYMARVTSFAGRRRLERDARPARAVR